MDALMIGFLAELAADLTSRLIQAVGAALRPKEKQEALKRCMRVAVATLVSRAATDLPADRQQHLEGLLTRFFGLDETLAELRKLLAGDLLDPDAMMNLFLRAGYDAETLPGLDLRAGLRFFEMAFVEEAVHEPALQADVQAGNALNQTRLLREMLALQREAAPRAVDLADARKRYCQLLTDRFRFLQLQGLGFTDRLLPRIELLELYVDLRARPEAPPHEAGERMARLSAKAPPLEAVEAAAAGAGASPSP